MTLLTERGPEPVTVRDSRTASLLSEHANAVQAYIRSGNDEPLRRLRRRHLQIAGRRVHLPVELAVLDRLAEGGELHYEPYRR